MYKIRYFALVRPLCPASNRSTAWRLRCSDCSSWHLARTSAASSFVSSRHCEGRMGLGDGDGLRAGGLSSTADSRVTSTATSAGAAVIVTSLACHGDGAR